MALCGLLQDDESLGPYVLMGKRKDFTTKGESCKLVITPNLVDRVFLNVPFYYTVMAK